MQTTNVRPASWTPEEDAMFVSILEQVILKEGKTLEEVYPIAAEKIGRPEGGCKYRYTSVLRKKLTGELKEKLVTNSPRGNAGKQNPPDNGALTRTKLIGRLQAVDKELGKMDGEIEKAEKLVAELKARKVELGQQMVNYTEALVKSALGEGEQLELKVGESA